MNTRLFNDFLASGDALWVYEDGKLAFSSDKDGLRPLLEYVNRSKPAAHEVVIFDKVMGNAAALLAVKVGCKEIYSPLGSQIAIKTLDQYDIKYHITTVVNHILQDNGVDMCPMEKLSLGKSPEEFFQAVSNIIKVG